MIKRSIDDTAMNDQSVMDPGDSGQLYDLVVRPGGGGAGEPPCDCAGPPPPQFLLPPPPVDPSWAAADEDVCDSVAPYQVCRGLAGGASSGDSSSSSLPMLAVVLTASGLLCVLLLIASIFFCRYRRRMHNPLSGKSSSKRADASRMLYGGLPVQTQVVPNNMRSNGHAPHIEMVAVKGQCAQLMPGGRGGGASTLFVYPPPPSLTDDGSEPLSNMYEEIPYYGRPAPSVSCCSDSDDDVISRPSEEEPGGPVARPCHLPTGEPRYVCTLPSGPVEGPARHAGPQPRPRSADRCRRSPASPVAAARPSLRRDASLRRKDPYYYSDILTRDTGGVPGSGGNAGGGGQYREPYDKRRPGGRAPLYSQPDVAAGNGRSPPGRSRDRGHVTPLANRIALDPFVDAYDGERRGSHRPRHKLSSFGSAGAKTPRGQLSPELSYASAQSRYPGDNDMSRFRPPLQWTH